MHAATDITGFGLFGHAVEIADNSGVTISIDTSAAPVFDGAYELAVEGIYSGGSKRGCAALGERVQVGDSADDAKVRMFFDAETSGGLLVALPEAGVEAAIARVRDAGSTAVATVGTVVAREDAAVRVS